MYINVTEKFQKYARQVYFKYQRKDRRILLERFQQVQGSKVVSCQVEFGRGDSFKIGYIIPFIKLLLYTRLGTSSIILSVFTEVENTF